MNKQEAIEKIKDLYSFVMEDGPFEVDLIIKNQVIDIISKIDEPQKIMVPKFVAEWIEEARAEEYSLYGAWEMVKEGSEIFWWLFDGHENNQDTFNRAWLDGYEVEQEKLYTVEIPNPNNEYIMNVLIRLPSSGKIALVTLHKPNTSYLKNKEYQLTEAEIKQDFDWAWNAGFAKEVEE